MKSLLFLIAGVVAASSMAQGRNAFIQQQAYAEMQRVSGQVDVLQNNFDELHRRVGKLESGNESQSMRHEIESLKSSIAELRRQMHSMREEIVKDLAGRIKKLQVEQKPSAPATVQKKVVVGPHREYVVQSGDTLSLISEAFGTTVAKIKEMNGLKNDNLRIGQKLMLPK
jgi:LysM repeat protein